MPIEHKVQNSPFEINLHSQITRDMNGRVMVVISGKMTSVTASAPGKCILFGEHVSIYYPAVANAIEQRINVTIKRNNSTTEDWKLDGLKFNPKNTHISKQLKAFVAF